MLMLPCGCLCLMCSRVSSGAMFDFSSTKLGSSTLKGQDLVTNDLVGFEGESVVRANAFCTRLRVFC